MLSCTEFIPCYSELFTFLEAKRGREELNRFWDYLFAPTGSGIPLINYVKEQGIRGCYSYWAGTLNEEAADFTMYLNEKGGWFMNVMHHCPSKGRLLALKDEIGLTPYHDYCLHCDSYRQAAEKVGLKYIYNFNGVDHAACSMLIYDPKVFDGRVIVDENTEIMDRRASQNEYFHKDFHSILNMGIHYVGEHYGKEALTEFLTAFTHHVYTPVLTAIKEKGLAAIQEKILDTYHREKAEDAVETSLTGDTLTVTVYYCPAVRHLLDTGRTVSPWYPYTTTAIMQTLAGAAGCAFTMDSYDETTGAASYHFTKK